MTIAITNRITITNGITNRITITNGITNRTIITFGITLTIGITLEFWPEKLIALLFVSYDFYIYICEILTMKLKLRTRFLNILFKTI